MNTILVTGGTGFIGSWVVKELLEKGNVVRLTVRNKSNMGKYQHINEMSDINSGSVEFYEADLLDVDALEKAAVGADVIVHIASPFILNVKDPQKELVDPALEGTKNVLNAASKSGTVKKVVLTSSVVSILGDAIDMHNQGLPELTEEHWNTTSNLNHQPYSFSKVLAEKAAWELEKAQSDWKLVVINPGFVMGPSLTGTSVSESLKFMKDMLSGKFKAGAAELYFGMVDVRDVAHAHVLALESDQAEGRHIVSNKVLNFLDLALLIEKSFPGKYKLPKKLAPKWLLLMMGWAFGLNRKFVKNNIGYPVSFNNSKIKSSLGLKFRDLDTSIKEMVEQIEENK